MGNCGIGSARRSTLMLAMSVATVLGGCSAAPDNEPNRIIAPVLAQLTAGQRPICVDSRTRGEPLAIFRTMIVAPAPSRRSLGWHKPGVLLPERTIGARALVENELSDSRTRLPLAETDVPFLSMVDQLRFNGLAREAMSAGSMASTNIRAVPQAPLALVRWWPRNRFDASCGETYTISKPVVIRNFAFVSVTAGHQGTTYALESNAGRWTPVAQWANWLY